MNIIVLSGSPKGDLSATLQYVRYLETRFPEHAFAVENVAQRIQQLEADVDAFDTVIDRVASADLVLWATPVYYMLVPAQLKRFVELVYQRGATARLAARNTAVLTTSIHFFDHTAHTYLHAVCDDLQMRWRGSYAADMYDLTLAGEREKLVLFAAHVFDDVAQGTPTQRDFAPLVSQGFEYQPAGAAQTTSAGGRRIVVLTDGRDEDSNLDRMARRFAASFVEPVETVSLHALGIKGGCLGCCRCGYNNECIYGGEDDFVQFFESVVKSADILVWCGSVVDRALSSTWKTFLDRSFYNGHAPALVGKQVAFLVAGPLGQLPNLREVLEAYVQVQRANLVGIVCDDVGDSAAIDGQLFALAKRAARMASEGYIAPMNSLGAGGAKVLRDDVWGRLRFPFRADHLRYTRLGIYDFPQRDRKSRFQNAFMLLLCRSPFLRREILSRMKPGIIAPLVKARAKAGKQDARPRAS